MRKSFGFVLFWLLTSVAADVGGYTYGLGHPMKPQRMRMTHELLSAYGMLDKMDVLVSKLVSETSGCCMMRILYSEPSEPQASK